MTAIDCSMIEGLRREGETGNEESAYIMDSRGAPVKEQRSKRKPPKGKGDMEGKGDA